MADAQGATACALRAARYFKSSSLPFFSEALVATDPGSTGMKSLRAACTHQAQPLVSPIPYFQLAAICKLWALCTDSNKQMFYTGLLTDKDKALRFTWKFSMFSLGGKHFFFRLSSFV